MIGRMLTGALVVASAVTGSQAPEFAQQYRQRLGGAVDELTRTVERFDADAASEGLTRDQALSRHIVNADELFRKRGQAMQETFLRLDRLKAQRQAMTDDSAFVRLASFASLADGDLARATFNTYEPAVPVTTEGGVMAGLFGFLGWLLARLLGAPKRMLNRRLAARAG